MILSKKGGGILLSGLDVEHKRKSSELVFCVYRAGRTTNLLSTAGTSTTRRVAQAKEKEVENAEKQDKSRLHVEWPPIEESLCVCACACVELRQFFTRHYLFRCRQLDQPPFFLLAHD